MRTFLVAILLFPASSANAQQVAPAPKFIRENSPVIALTHVHRLRSRAKFTDTGSRFWTDDHNWGAISTCLVCRALTLSYTNLGFAAQRKSHLRLAEYGVPLVV